MFCKNCGAQIGANSDVCLKCGCKVASDSEQIKEDKDKSKMYKFTIISGILEIMLVAFGIVIVYDIFKNDGYMDKSITYFILFASPSAIIAIVLTALGVVKGYENKDLPFRSACLKILISTLVIYLGLFIFMNIVPDLL